MYPLPVPAQPLNTQFFVNNVPHQQPPFPQVNVPPTLQQFAPLVWGLIVMEVQQYASSNGPRMFFANLLSRNNWNNPEAMNVAATVFEIVDYFLSTQQGSPDQIVPAAVTKGVRLMLAVYTTQFQEGLRQYLTSPGIVNDLNTAINEFQQLRTQIQQFVAYRNNMQMNQMGATFGGVGGPLPGMGPMQGNGWNGGWQNVNNGAAFNSGLNFNNGASQFTAGPAPSATPIDVGSLFTEQYAPVTDAFSQQPLSGRFGPSVPNSLPETQPSAPSIQSFTGAPNGNVTVVYETATPAAKPEPQAQVDDGFMDLDAIYGKPAAQPVQPVEPTTKAKPKMTDGFKATNPERPYDELEFADGSIVKPAHASGWTTSRSNKQPYHLAYNPNTSILFHLKLNDGTVHEFLRERTVDMEPYVNHELDSELREAEQKRLNATRGEQIVDWSGVIALDPEPSKPYAVRDPEADIAKPEVLQLSKKLRQVEGVVPVKDLASAEAVVTTAHPELMKIKNDHTIEFYIERLSLRTASSDLEGYFKDLNLCSSYEQLAYKLQAAMVEKPEEKQVWEYVNQRLTEVTNELLNTSMAISWKMGSYIEDIEELIVELEKDYGDELVEKFRNQTRLVIDLVLNVTTSAIFEVSEDEDSSENESLNPKVEQEPLGWTVQFASRASFTRVPYTLLEMGVAFEGPAAVTHANLPMFYDMIDAIFARTSDYPVPFENRLLLTSDGNVYELFTAALADDTYLINHRKLGL